MEMRDVVGYEDYYAVTDDGRVWSKRKRAFFTKHLNSAGYDQVRFRVDGVITYHLTHRLVCRAFHGEPPTDEHQVDHINADRVDNRACNLRWVTQAENMAHMVEMGNSTAIPIVGFNESGETLRFSSLDDARKAGFQGVGHILHHKQFLAKGFTFVRESDWEQVKSCIGVYFEQMEEVRARRQAAKYREQRGKPKPRPCRVRGTSVVDGSVVEFPNLQAAVEAGYTSVGACLRGELKTCGKRTWEALGDYNPCKRKSGAGRKAVPVRLIGTSLEDGSTIEFGSFKEAREAGYPDVNACIRGVSKTCKGYTWEAPGYVPRKYKKGTVVS